MGNLLIKEINFNQDGRSSYRTPAKKAPCEIHSMGEHARGRGCRSTKGGRCASKRDEGRVQRRWTHYKAFRLPRPEVQNVGEQKFR